MNERIVTQEMASNFLKQINRQNACNWGKDTVPKISWGWTIVFSSHIYFSLTGPSGKTAINIRWHYKVRNFTTLHDYTTETNDWFHAIWSSTC